jgi:uncharacterized protein (TIGR02300 family)
LTGGPDRGNGNFTVTKLWGRALVNQDLGTKRVCSDCAAKFYDLNKNPMVCPKCGHEEAVTVPRAKRKAPEPVAPVVKEAPAEKAKEEEEGDVVVGAETSLDELAAEEKAAAGDDDDSEDDILAIDDEEEDDPFLPDDDDEDDDVSDLIPGVKDDT